MRDSQSCNYRGKKSGKSNLSVLVIAGRIVCACMGGMLKDTRLKKKKKKDTRLNKSTYKARVDGEREDHICVCLSGWDFKIKSMATGIINVYD